MLKEHTPRETNSSVVIDNYEYETPRVPWRAISVDALPEFRLNVTFRDGVAGVVEMSEMIHGANAGVFSTLKDPEVFREVSVIFGAVTWANGLDLAPDAMHDELERNGVWILR